jgi:hypothetical protein
MYSVHLLDTKRTRIFFQDSDKINIQIYIKYYNPRPQHFSNPLNSCWPLPLIVLLFIPMHYDNYKKMYTTVQQRIFLHALNKNVKLITVHAKIK